MGVRVLVWGGVGFGCGVLIYNIIKCACSQVNTRDVHCGLHVVVGKMVWYGIVWHGMAWYRMVSHDMVWYGVAWYRMARYGMAWYGMVWYGMVWCVR